MLFSPVIFAIPEEQPTRRHLLPRLAQVTSSRCEATWEATKWCPITSDAG